MNVFVTWSGQRSHAVAKILHDWIPDVIQRVQPFLSSEETAKGSNWGHEITTRLRTCPVGIICLTPENLTAPWILFEAGAISNNVEVLLSQTGQEIGVGQPKACTYLYDLAPTDVQKPLEMFQATVAKDKVENRKMLNTINDALGKEKMDGQQLDRVFEKYWPDLAEKLSAIPKPKQAVPPKRSFEDIMLDVLTEVRSLSRQIAVQEPRRITRTVENPESGLTPDALSVLRLLSWRRGSVDSRLTSLLSMSEQELQEQIERDKALAASQEQRRGTPDQETRQKPDPPANPDKK
jgi:hypothetical protein